MRPLLLLILTTLLSALAVGAMWALLASAWPAGFSGFAVVAAAVLGATMRATSPRGAITALLTVAALGLATIYAAGLTATLHLAAAVGVSVREALRVDGLAGFWEFGMAALHRRDLPWLALAAVLAVALTTWPRRREA